MKAELIIAIAGVICAALTYLNVRQANNNKRLRQRLRIALQDCQAFHRLEETYCETIKDLSPQASATSTLAVKRAIRIKVRATRDVTPSGFATPQQLHHDLQTLT